jgi:hypothetical protein
MYFDKERQEDRKRGRDYVYGGAGGCFTLILNAIFIIAIVLLIASCLFETPGV